MNAWRACCFFFLTCAPLQISAASPASLESLIIQDKSVTANAGQITLSYSSAVEKSLPSVVTILRQQKEEENDQSETAGSEFDLVRPKKPVQKPIPKPAGSGVILSKEGHILTNHHVVDEAQELFVRLNGEGKNLPAKLVGTDPMTDIALLKVDLSPKDAPLQPITITDSSNIKRGDIAMALGSPFGIEQTVTLGIVSGTGRTMNFINQGYEDFIQTDAPINPGNSGGALVDGSGRLIGINTAVYINGWAAANGLGFAVPSNLAIRVASDLLQHGYVVRGYVGIGWQAVDEETALKLTGRTDLRPAQITTIEAGTPAEKAGFMQGDIVLALNKQPIQTSDRLRFAVATMVPGDKVIFTVLRGSDSVELQAELVARHDDAARVEVLKKSLPGLPGIFKSVEIKTDVHVADMPSAIRKKLNVPDDIIGSVVVNHTGMSDKLNRGDVILSVNGVEAKTSENLNQIIKQQKPGRPVMLRVWFKGKTRFVLLSAN